MKITCIAHPAALAKPACQRELQAMQAATPMLQLQTSTHPGHALELARVAAAHNDCLVAIGGDGTVHEVLNGIMSADVLPGQRPALGILAFGTANDFIKSIALRGNAEDMINAIAAQRVRLVDVGHIDYREHSGNSVQRYFLNVADLGLGADVVRRVAHSRRTLGASFTFLKSIVLALRHFRPLELTLTTDTGDSIGGRYTAVIVGNGRYFGSGLCAVPQAQLDDGKLHIACIGDIGTRDLLRHLRDLRLGREIRHPAVRYLASRSLTITARGRPAALEADGEYLGSTPVTLSIEPGGIPLLDPPGPRRRAPAF